MLDLVESGSHPLFLATFSEDSKQRGNPFILGFARTNLGKEELSGLLPERLNKGREGK